METQNPRYAIYFLDDANYLIRTDNGLWAAISIENTRAFVSETFLSAAKYLLTLQKKKDIKILQLIPKYNEEVIVIKYVVLNINSGNKEEEVELRHIL